MEKQQKLLGTSRRRWRRKVVFRRESKKTHGFSQEKCEKNAAQAAEQKSLLCQAGHKNEVAAAQLEQLRGYAEAFERGTLAKCWIIASAFIEHVTVYSGFELEIQFRVGIDSLVRLPGITRR